MLNTWALLFRKHPALAWSIVIAATAIGVFLRLIFPLNSPFVTMVPALVVSTVIAGRLAGLASLAASTIAAVGFIHPLGPWAEDPWGVISVAVYVIVGAFIIFVIDQFDRTRRQMQEDHDRLAKTSERLQLAIRAALAGSWEWELPENLVWDRSFYEMLGLDPDGPVLTVEKFMTMVHPDDRELLLSNRRATLAGGPPRPTDEYRIYRPDGKMLWLKNYRIKSRIGKNIIGVTQNISESKETEAQIRLLLAELSHRVKNQYSVILAMLRQTSAVADDPAHFYQLAVDRISALAHSHDLLVGRNWRGASIAELLRSQVAGFGAEDRVTSEGPEIVLKPHAVQYLGIAFHELATNASKHGGLSHPGGGVHVTWRVTDEKDKEKRLSIMWRETGVPAAKPKRSKGFGRKVLEQLTPAALDGTVELWFGDNSILWTLNASVNCISWTEQGR